MNFKNFYSPLNESEDELRHQTELGKKLGLEHKGKGVYENKSGDKYFFNKNSGIFSGWKGKLDPNNPEHHVKPEKTENIETKKEELKADIAEKKDLSKNRDGSDFEEIYNAKLKKPDHIHDRFQVHGHEFVVHTTRRKNSSKPDSLSNYTVSHESGMPLFIGSFDKKGIEPNVNQIKETFGRLGSHEELGKHLGTMYREFIHREDLVPNPKDFKNVFDYEDFQKRVKPLRNKIEKHLPKPELEEPKKQEPKLENNEFSHLGHKFEVKKDGSFYNIHHKESGEVIDSFHESTSRNEKGAMDRFVSNTLLDGKKDLDEKINRKVHGYTEIVDGKKLVGASDFDHHGGYKDGKPVARHYKTGNEVKYDSTLHSYYVTDNKVPEYEHDSFHKGSGMQHVSYKTIGGQKKSGDVWYEPYKQKRNEVDEHFADVKKQQIEMASGLIKDKFKDLPDEHKKDMLNHFSKKDTINVDTIDTYNMKMTDDHKKIIRASNYLKEISPTAMTKLHDELHGNLYNKNSGNFDVGYYDEYGNHKKTSIKYHDTITSNGHEYVIHDKINKQGKILKNEDYTLSHKDSGLRIGDFKATKKEDFNNVRKKAQEYMDAIPKEKVDNALDSWKKQLEKDKEK